MFTTSRARKARKSEKGEATREARGAQQKTAGDVAHFKEFLVTIRSYHGAIEDLPEATLSDYLCEFLSGVKKRTDGTDYQPDSL